MTPLAQSIFDHATAINRVAAERPTAMNNFANALRRLAESIEGHQIAKGELVAAGIDSAGEPYLQLDPQPFDRVVGEHEWTEDSVDPGHVRAMIGGVLVTTVLDKGERFRRGRFGPSEIYRLATQMERDGKVAVAESLREAAYRLDVCRNGIPAVIGGEREVGR